MMRKGSTIAFITEFSGFYHCAACLYGNREYFQLYLSLILCTNHASTP